MRFSLISCLNMALGLASARYVLYVDQYHLTDLPNRTVTAGVDTVIMAFANSSLFLGSGDYTPFESVSIMRSRFDPGTKVLLSVGGWGDTDGLSAGALTAESRLQYAQNVAKTIDRLGFDGLDVDWEHPAGNGADYKQHPNSEKVSQITTYPLLLAAIKCEIGDKILSIAVPGLERDMIAFTPEKSLEIWAAVDFVNVMTYDLMNRRDNITTHHTSVEASLKTINHYLDVLHLPPSKANLGFAFYAKYFNVDANAPCTTGLGCETVLLENADGSDTGKSGTITFEKANYLSAPTNLTLSPDGSCGASVFHYCPSGYCCSQYGFCGNTADYCGSSCQADYGICNGVSISTLFKKAMKNGVEDVEQGGEYFYDAENSVFWTWDTPALIARKFEEIVEARGLGGVMAWSAGQDSFDWSHMLALQKGVENMRCSRSGLEISASINL